MQVSRTLSKITLQFLKKYNQIENNQIEIIEYGLTIFFSTIIKILIILIVSFIFGITKEVFLSIIVFAILRHFAGGIHAKTPLSCLISMFIIYFSIYIISSYITINEYALFIYFIFCLIIILLYAPADVIEKPIISLKQKKKLKYSSIIVLIILFTIAYIINSNTIKNIIVLSCIVECITLMPIIYTITNTESGDNYENRKT